MPSLSDVAIGGYAVVMTGITILLMGVLESCNMVNLPPIAEHGGLAKEECYAMTTAMMKAAPRGKETAGEILALFFHVVFRIEQNYILCSAIAAWYVLQVPGRGGAQALAPVPRPTERLLRLVRRDVRGPPHRPRFHGARALRRRQGLDHAPLHPGLDRSGRAQCPRVRRRKGKVGLADRTLFSPSARFSARVYSPPPTSAAYRR